MAEINPNVPQAVDPEVLVDLTRLLQIRGPLGVLNVLDTIVPVVSLGNVVTPDINIRPPVFNSTTIFSNGIVAAPVAGALLADTGQLLAGIYDVIVMSSVQETTVNQLRLQHRNAADSANLMEVAFNAGLDTIISGYDKMTFSYEVALNERLRVDVTVVGSVGSRYSSVIFMRVR